VRGDALAADAGGALVDVDRDGRDVAITRYLLGVGEQPPGQLELRAAIESTAALVIVLRNEGRTAGVVSLCVLDSNRDGRPDLLIAEPCSLSWWENR
jgi:hypothetical protein